MYFTICKQTIVGANRFGYICATICILIFINHLYSNSFIYLAGWAKEGSRDSRSWHLRSYSRIYASIRWS